MQANCAFFKIMLILGPASRPYGETAIRGRGIAGGGCEKDRCAAEGADTVASGGKERDVDSDGGAIYKEGQLGQVELPAMRPAVFAALLKFFYAGYDAKLLPPQHGNDDRPDHGVRHHSHRRDCSAVGDSDQCETETAMRETAAGESLPGHDRDCHEPDATTPGVDVCELLAVADML